MRYGKLMILLAVGSLAACTPTHPSAPAVVNQAMAPTLPKGSTSSVSPMEVPPGLSSDALRNDYAVPSVSAAPASTAPVTTATNTNASLLPPGSGLEKSAQQAVAPAPAPVPQMTAAQAAAAQQAALGNVGLSVKSNYNQAWKQVGKASSAAGYPVMEEDSSAGTYYVLDKAGSGGVIKRDTPIYQLKVQKQGNDSTMITVTNAQNQPVDPATTQRILSAVKNKLQ